MSAMSVIAVNVGKPQHIPGHKDLTGIIKLPASGPVRVGEYGLEGDAVLDKKHHGGLDQAVYLYGQPDYDYFAHDLGKTLSPGLFGDNLTIAGLESGAINIGDRFEIGDVLLEANSPRNPCATFAARMGDPHWVKYFHAAQRPGVYARVLRTGTIEAGLTVRHIPFDGPSVPVTALMSDYKKPAPERMRWLMKAPIHRALVEKYQGLLAQGQLPL